MRRLGTSLPTALIGRCHSAAVLHELVEEVPDADLLPGYHLLVKVGQEAFGLVQDDHVVFELEARTA